MNDLETIKENLILKSPAKRLKFLRQKVIKKNQDQFCQDGIIRSSTLKFVETERLKISPRIAERLVHKLRLEGIICKEEIFLEHNSDCQIILDDSREKIIGPSSSNLEEIRKKLSILTPLHIDKELCPSIAPNGATALARELREDDLLQLNKTLCFVQGAKTFVSLLTYENNQILSDNDGKIEYFPTNIINFCGMYAIEILYFNN
ncbi:MAG: hypothetical protein BGO43_13515 [Gammaproteobacteria bacterium 39-13]|jgi:hypothetical protein|nr:hypothetical protein [Gammaproteobacteria bacterium]OJV94764.1 MAG: hypothetical protein BGO43_13515 [Gammaproteobacteria bacterium 39-13]